MDNEKPELRQGSQRPLATLHLEFDLDTHVLHISGAVPMNAIGLDMARRLVDHFAGACEDERRAANARAIVGPGAHVVGRFGRG